MKTINFIVLFLVTFCVNLPLLCDAELLPRWTKILPNGSNESHKFIDVISYGNNVDEARKQSFDQLRFDEQLLASVKIKSKMNQEMQMNDLFTNGEWSSESMEKRSIVVSVDGEPFSLQVNKIDEYVKNDHGRIILHTLYQVATTNNPVFDKVQVTTQYGAWGLLSILPGAGQMYKGDFLKGGLFMGAGVLGATGIVLCESNRAAYSAKVSQQPKYAQQYSTKANNWCLGRDICIGLTAGVWVWNIIDAFVAKGARRVVQNNNRFSMVTEPQFDPFYRCYDPSVGVALKL